MVEITLAAVVGALVLAIVLMNRKVRQLERLAGELLADATAQKITQIMPNGNGGGGDTPEPDRRKRHLGLYIGGAIASAAALGERAWRSHRPATIATATATAAAAAVAGALYLNPGRGEPHRDGVAAPTLPPTATAPPTPSRDPAPTPTSRPTGSGAPSPSRNSATPTTLPQPSGMGGNNMTSAPPATPSPDSPGNNGDGPSDGNPGGGGGGGETTSPTAPPTPTKPPQRGLCLDVEAAPILAAGACLLGQR